MVAVALWPSDNGQERTPCTIAAGSRRCEARAPPEYTVGEYPTEGPVSALANDQPKGAWE